MLKKKKRSQALFCLLLLTLSYQLLALEIPVLRARVNDYGQMISPQTEVLLENKLQEIEKTDSTQIFILTIPSLEGESLEEYTINVAEAWKVGQNKLDNGVILFVSRDDHKIRIEVGYGLEGVLTDAMSRRIIANEIAPQFRVKNYDQGFINAVQGIIQTVAGEYQATAKQTSKKTDKKGHSIFLILLIILFFSGFNRFLTPILGAISAPIFGLTVLGLGLWSFLLIPVGLILGFVISLIMSISHFGGGPGGFGGYGGGGFSSGGFGGGGFSGGGGGSFGGGGASGSW